MYTYKRFKTSKSMMKTSLLLLAAAFMLGLIALTAGGAANSATFMAELAGNVSGVSEPTTQKTKLSAKAFNFRNTSLDLSFFHNGANGALDSDDAAACFPDGVTTGILMVTKLERGPHPSGAWFWFKGSGTDGKEVTYVLVMSGTFPDEPWPPTPESDSIAIPLDSWEIVTEGKKNKSACTGEGVFPDETTVTVTRMN